jgi:plasmid stabilization system protein ParE
MRIEWSAPALADLVDIRNFIGQYDDAIARNVAARIIASAD